MDGFISHLLCANVEVTMIDVRPFPNKIDGLHFIQGNATELKNISNSSINSLSSLHAIEHFGLGRYGDPIDKNAWVKALHEYERVLMPGGILYLSVPIGPENKLMFNAHRIFNPKTIVNELRTLSIVSFRYIKNMQVLDCNPEKYQETEDYLCGLFCFRKKEDNCIEVQEA